jgi:orotate phosphoribosyltransferase-like protein
MTNDQPMIQVLSNVIAEYARIETTKSPFSVEEIKEEINVSFEGHFYKQNDESGEEKAPSPAEINVKCRTLRKLEHKRVQCRSRQVKGEKNDFISNYF